MRTLAPGTWVETVDNAVNLDDFPPGGADGEPPTVLFVGVICRRKGLFELARAARALRERGVRDWNLIVVGGQGPTPQTEYDEIVAEFATAGLTESLVGPEYGDQIKSRLGQADIFVLPSLSEARPRSILEAMLAELPVVASDVGGIPTVVEHEASGLLVPPSDPSALADALDRLAASEATRIRLGKAGRQYVEQECQPERTAGKYVDTYRAMIANARLARRQLYGAGPLSRLRLTR